MAFNPYTRERQTELVALATLMLGGEYQHHYRSLALHECAKEYARWNNDPNGAYRFRMTGR